MSSIKLGINIAATAVNLAAKCSGSAALFGPARTSANPNMLSQIKHLMSVPVQVLAKTEGQKGELGGSIIVRIPKSLDYLHHAFLGFSLTPLRIKFDPKLNVLATVRMKQDWSALLIRCVRLMVQDLTLSEADWFAALMHVHANVRVAHRDNFDQLMGNTPSWLTAAGYNPATGVFDLLGDDNSLYVPLPILAMPSGHHARPFITGAAIFNDIRIEIDFSDLADLVEISNGACGTVAFDASANGRAATVSDLETCNGTCPDLRDVHVIAHGAVGSTDEKKALSTMSASQQLKVYSKTMYVSDFGHAESSVEVRSSSAAQAVYSAVLCTTHGRVSADFSAFAGSGQSAVESMRIEYENTSYIHGNNATSLLQSVNHAHDCAHRNPFVFFTPFDHVVDSDVIRGIVELGKISQVYVTHVPNAVAAAAVQGFDIAGNPIPAANGHQSCVAGVQGSPGVAQRYTVAVLLQQVVNIQYRKSAVQLVL
jgi:hypothetical protein